jgi:uncharacterized membrane protein (UPF0127 family)
MSWIPDSALSLFESYCRQSQVDGKEIEIKVGDVPVRAKVASTQASQAKGYMGAKDSPKDSEGILFVYDQDRPLQFWMKGVGVPLDIIFFDSNMDHVGHETMSKFEGEKDHELTRYSSPKPARFALEVRGGWCKDHLKTPCKLSL